MDASADAANAGVHSGDSLAAGGPSHRDRQWFIATRWQEFEGEARANLLRIVGIGSFYIIELLNYYGLRLGFLELAPVAGVDRRFHLTISLLAAAWTLVSLGIMVCLRARIFPAALKFVSTGCDVVFLSCMLMAADGPKSPLVVGYFLVLTLAALRFSLPLVWFATLASMGGYLWLLGYVKWWANPARGLRIERYQQLILLLALALTGVVLGQIVRRVRRLAEDYAARAAR